MNKVIPTIFAHSKEEFSSRFKKLLPVSENLQIDFMDGKFVPAKSMTLEDVPDLKKYKNNFEAHIMVENPESWIDKIKEKGFKKIIPHIEAIKDFKEFENSGLEIWIAINPGTSLEKLSLYINKITGVLFMGIQPGKENQEFIHSVYMEIERLKKQNPKIRIQVDGGANEEVAQKLAALGVDCINSGSFIANAEDPKAAFKKLEEAFKC